MLCTRECITYWENTIAYTFKNTTGVTENKYYPKGSGRWYFSAEVSSICRKHLNSLSPFNLYYFERINGSASKFTRRLNIFKKFKNQPNFYHSPFQFKPDSFHSTNIFWAYYNLSRPGYRIYNNMYDLISGLTDVCNKCWRSTHFFLMLVIFMNKRQPNVAERVLGLKGTWF